MRRPILVYLLGWVALVPSVVWAAPPTPTPITLLQPNGHQFEARVKGDEWGAWTETADGYTVVQEAGVWYYATLDNGTLVPTAMRVGLTEAKNLATWPKHLRPAFDYGQLPDRTIRHLTAGLTKSSTTQPLLIIMVSFTDTAFVYSAASFSTLFFGASGSVADYYDENSYGEFDVVQATESQGTVNDGIVSVALGYNHPNFGNTYGASRNQLVRDAVAAADAFINYASYDADANGTVEPDELAILLIVAGYENSYTGVNAKTPRVWAHQGSFSSPMTHDAVDIHAFAMAGERHGTTGEPDHQATIGILAHELGHLFFGLPDLYDRDGSSAGIGEWGLMGSGSWTYTGGNELGSSPAHFSAWCKVQTGMVTPADISATTAATVYPTHSTPSIVRLWVDKYRIGEHFLVENRALGGYDAGLPGAGLLIWHADTLTSQQNDDESNKAVDLEEADGLTDLDSGDNEGTAGDPYPGTSNNTAFTDVSTPNSKANSGATTGIGVTSISLAKADYSALFNPGTIGMGNYIGYDEDGYTGNSIGYNSTTAWTALRITNDSGFERLEGFEVYVSETATVDFYLYESINAGSLGSLVHSEPGFVASEGWNRFLLATPQIIPANTDRVIVLRIVTTGDLFPVYYDATGENSGRSYIDSDGFGTFLSLSGYGDLNQHALFGADPVSVIWVDFSYVGVESGSESQPFNTLAEGLAAVPSGGTINIEPGTSTETLSINQDVRLDAPNGSVRIGVP